jgi:Uma2 family endonuclease
VGIAECWIVDPSSREIEVFREPAGSRFATARRHGVGAVVSPLAFPDVAMDVAEIFR